MNFNWQSKKIDKLLAKEIPIFSICFREHMIKDVLHNAASFDVKRKLGESDRAFHRRKTAETITFDVQLEPFTFNKRTPSSMIDKTLEIA